METEPLNNQGIEESHDSKPLHGSQEVHVHGSEEIHRSKEIHRTEEVHGSEEIHEGQKASGGDISKTCPPKLSGEEKHLSLQALQEPDELSRKSLKERVSPSKKMEELEEAAGLGDANSDPQPDSKDLKKVKENTPSPREITN